MVEREIFAVETGMAVNNNARVRFRLFWLEQLRASRCYIAQQRERRLLAHSYVDAPLERVRMGVCGQRYVAIRGICERSLFSSEAGVIIFDDVVA